MQSPPSQARAVPFLKVPLARPAALRLLQESEEGSYLQNWTALAVL
jgi:hypothetical protein